MKIVTSVAAMQRLAKRWRAEKVRVGFVPTMGYLHAGHLSLIQRARQFVGRQGRVVVSIYVNPTQFAPTEDLAKYPRDLARDKQLCRLAGTDVLFVPTDAEMYPAKDAAKFSTFVVEETLSHPMEGAVRPTHFRGVTTVVAKLFNLVLPDVAVFGAKDFQQAAVIQRLVRDLNFPVKVVVAPTRRETDGLALSSRNKYLASAERLQATVLWRSIQMAQQMVKAETVVSGERLKMRVAELVAHEPAARLDYVEFFDPTTLCPSPTVERGTRMALAVFVGKTRLIDNAAM